MDGQFLHFKEIYFHRKHSKHQKFIQARVYSFKIIENKSCLFFTKSPNRKTISLSRNAGRKKDTFQ